MPPRPVKKWIDIIATRDTPLKLAEFILADTVGYRPTSKWRAADVDNLAAALQALIEVTKQQEAKR